MSFCTSFLFKGFLFFVFGWNVHCLFISSSFLAFNASSSRCFLFSNISYISFTLNDFFKVLVLYFCSGSVGKGCNSSLNILRLNEDMISSSRLFLFSNFFKFSKLFFLFVSSNLSRRSCFFFTRSFDHVSLIPKTNTKNSFFIALHSFSVKEYLSKSKFGK